MRAPRTVLVVLLLAAAPAARGQLDCGVGFPVSCSSWTPGTTVGGLDGVTAWPCAGGDLSGAEAVHAFELAADERVSFLLDDSAEPSLDLFVLDACDPAACLGSGDRRVDLELSAGSYLLVVDGRGGVESDYRLGAACGADLQPRLLETTAAPGDCFVEHKTGWLAAPQVSADVLFAIDLTNSMGQEREQLQAVMQDVVDRLRGLVPDVAFGLASYRDYFTSGGGFDPCTYNAGTYGGFGDWPWRVEQAVTTDRALIQAAVDALPPAGGGNDGPEACSRMMLEAAEDPAVAWRPGARRLLVSLSDAVPHDCNLVECLGGSGTPFGPDLGRDGQPDTGDEIAVLDAVDALVREGVTLLHLDSSGGAVLDGFTLQEIWNCWAQRTGGEAVALAADGSVPGGVDLAELVASLARGRLGGCERLELVPEPGYEDWLSSAEPVYLDVAPGGAWDFELVLCVPEDAPDGLHEFRVELHCDGEAIASQQVRVEVAAPCLEPALGAVSSRDIASCNLGVALSWEPADFSSGSGVYNVYRSELSCADALSRPPVATGLTATAWQDGDTVRDGRYWHVVEAEDSAAGSPCPETGPVFGGSVARSCAGPTRDFADDASVPEGVHATLRVRRAGGSVIPHWPAARDLLPGETFHLLAASEDASSPFLFAGPDDGLARELEDGEPASALRFYDLRVQDPCGSLSRDEYPPSVER